jgi:hypothetical protein
VKEVYSKREVVELLILNNNNVMKLLDDNKRFKIILEDGGEVVICERVRAIFPNSRLSTYTFDEVIQQLYDYKT